jgi:hypothetical protein
VSVEEVADEGKASRTAKTGKPAADTADAAADQE